MILKMSSKIAILILALSMHTNVDAQDKTAERLQFNTSYPGISSTLPEEYSVSVKASAFVVENNPEVVVETTIGREFEYAVDDCEMSSLSTEGIFRWVTDGYYKQEKYLSSFAGEQNSKRATTHRENVMGVAKNLPEKLGLKGPLRPVSPEIPRVARSFMVVEVKECHPPDNTLYCFISGEDGLDEQLAECLEDNLAQRNYHAKVKVRYNFIDTKIYEGQ